MSWCVWDWFDGNWGAERELTFETNDTPALIEFRQTLFLVHKGGSDDDIWWSTLSGEGGFQPEKTYGGRSYSGVGLAVFKDTLFMVHRGKEDDQGLYWTYFNPTSGSFEQDKPFTMEIDPIEDRAYSYLKTTCIVCTEVRWAVCPQTNISIAVSGIKLLRPGRQMFLLILHLCNQVQLLSHFQKTTSGR
jgi:hypothetical protein